MREVPDLSSLQQVLYEAKGRRASVQKSMDTVEAQIVQLEDEAELLSLVSTLFRSFIDKEVKTGVGAVTALQTEGLQTIFHDMDLQVNSDVEVKRGKVSVDLRTTETKGELVVEGSSQDSFGGSVLSVQSALLRITLVFRWGLRPFILLDETLPAFDSNYIENVGLFLSTLCEQMGIDILAVTQNPSLFDASPRRYRITKQGEESFFTEAR